MTEEELTKRIVDGWFGDTTSNFPDDTHFNSIVFNVLDEIGAGNKYNGLFGWNGYYSGSMANAIRANDRKSLLQEDVQLRVLIYRTESPNCSASMQGANVKLIYYGPWFSYAHSGIGWTSYYDKPKLVKRTGQGNAHDRKKITSCVSAVVKTALSICRRLDYFNELLNQICDMLFSVLDVSDGRNCVIIGHENPDMTDGFPATCLHHGDTFCLRTAIGIVDRAVLIAVNDYNKQNNNKFQRYLKAIEHGIIGQRMMIKNEKTHIEILSIATELMKKYNANEKLLLQRAARKLCV